MLYQTFPAVSLSNLSIYNKQMNTEASNKNNIFKISGSISNEKFDGAYSISSSRSMRLGHAKTKNLNHVGPSRIKNSSFCVGPVLYQIFKSNLIMWSRNIKGWKTNPKYEYSSNRITFKVNTEHYLELSTPQTMKILAISEKKINKDKSCENIPWLKPT